MCFLLLHSCIAYWEHRKYECFKLFFFFFLPVSVALQATQWGSSFRAILQAGPRLPLQDSMLPTLAKSCENRHTVADKEINQSPLFQPLPLASFYEKTSGEWEIAILVAFRYTTFTVEASICAVGTVFLGTTCGPRLEEDLSFQIRFLTQSQKCQAFSLNLWD